MRKSIFIIFTLFFIEASMVGAVEKESHSYRPNFFAQLNRTTFNPGGDIVPFASNKSVRQAEAMRGMGIAGAIIFGLSWPVIIAGAALLAYTYVLSAGTMATLVWAILLGGTSITNSYINSLLLIYYSGIALTVIGSVMFFVGIPLMIVGFVLYGVLRKKSRTAMFLQPSYEENSLYLSYGVRFKI